MRASSSVTLLARLETAVGVDDAAAAGWIRGMHGPHRMPTLLTWVDQLAKRVRG